MALLKTTWKHVRRSPYQALAAVMIMSLTFFVISVFTFIIAGTSRVISYFESTPQVTAFFKQDSKLEDIDALRKQIDSSGKAAKIKFVSKQEALKLYREQNKNDPLLLDLVTEDVLPSSLEVSTYRIEDLQTVSEMFTASTAVDKVIFQKDVVAKLTSFTNGLRTTGIVLIGVLSMVSIFLIVTIIGIKLSQKRDEIEIMRLLGATSWYIRWPFLFEGMFYGFLGAFFGFLIATGILLYATPYLMTFLGSIPVLPVSPILLFEMLAFEALLATILGMFASSIAVLRYLK